MQSFFHRETPLGVRVLCASLVLVPAMYVAFLFAMSVDHPTPRTLSVTCFGVLVGFLSLGMTWTPQRPRFPMQVAIGFGIVAAAYVLIGLPIPPRASSLGSQGSMIAVVLLSTAVLATQVRRPRLAFLLLVLLGLVGVLFALSGAILAATTVLPPAARYPSWQVALVVGASLAALWHGRVLRTGESGALLLLHR
ncbi:MAG: hypothetical protein ABJE47_21565 [bacterium]